MSRFVGIALVLLSGCAQREVDVVIYTPEDCCVPVGDRECVEDPCPLRIVGSIRVELEEADGSLAKQRCISPPEGLCRYEDLSAFTLLEGIEPSDGVELRVHGFEDGACGALRAFNCESFGENVIDLREDGVSEVPLWCDCPAESDL